MPEVVSFTAPHQVALVACEEQPLTPGSVRVRTWFSGISAGTELTAYRGSNPYLTGTWDPDRRLFIEGEPTFGYPVDGWGYSEVGEVVEVADGVVSPAVGDVVHGIWGHRSEAVLPAANVAHRVWTADDAISGTFARVGSIALNAVLAADTRLGDRLAVFGQGVIGLLATRLATLAGARRGRRRHAAPPARRRARDGRRRDRRARMPREAPARSCVHGPAAASTPPSS